MRTLIGTLTVLLALLLTGSSTLARQSYQVVRTHAGFNHIYGLATDTDGNVYTVDGSRGQVIELSPSGSLLQRFRIPGGCAGLGGIAISPAGALYVVSACSGQVYAFGADGKIMRAFGRPAGFNATSYRKNPASVVGPGSVAVGPSGHVYVTYCGAASTARGSSIQEFTGNGRRLAVLAASRIRCPYGLAVGRQGTMYVATSEGFFTLSPAGAVLGQWGKLGSGLAYLENPGQPVLDGQGHIYIPDGGNVTGDVAEFTTGGRFIRLAIRGGYTPDRVVRPSGVAVDGQGRLYVTDFIANHIARFTQSGTLQAVWNP